MRTHAWLFVGTDVASGEAQRLLSDAKIEFEALRSDAVDGVPVLIDRSGRYDGIAYIKQFIQERQNGDTHP